MTREPRASGALSFGSAGLRPCAQRPASGSSSKEVDAASPQHLAFAGVAGVFTIGSASRLLRVPVATIRTWERRYNLIVPARSAGGQRLYTRGQLEQLRFIAERVAGGMRPGEAHRLLRTDDDDVRTLRLELTAAAPAAGEARHAVDRLAAGLPDDLRFRLRLLVSELVANSVRHGRTETVRIAARLAGDLVHVDVSDNGSGFDWEKPRSRDGDGGRGLPLVAALADRWGLTFEGGTTAWFELRRAGTPAAVRPPEG
jgi:DNA-binding transcriptional MerR regulator